MDEPKDKYELVPYSRYYREDRFKHKIVRIAKKAGGKLLYAALILYYVLADPKFPTSQKVIIWGALGYLILPVDLIPDMIPAFGLTDDLATLLLAIKAVIDYITPEIKEKARMKVVSLLGKTEEKEFDIF